MDGLSGRVQLLLHLHWRAARLHRLCKPSPAGLVGAKLHKDDHAHDRADAEQYEDDDCADDVWFHSSVEQCGGSGAAAAAMRLRKTVMNLQQTLVAPCEHNEKI